MGTLLIDKALELLTSEKQKERSDGLAGGACNANCGWSSSDLNDKACHKIFESLFRFVAVERLIYNRAQRSNSRSPSTARLSTCASVLRTTVDIFLRNLRFKTVRAIIDHITETISAPGEGLWEPLSVDYTKCLASLLRYAPHIEHLGDAEWEKLIDFCLAVISNQDSDESQLSIRTDGQRSAPEDLPDVSDSRSTPSRMTPAPALREKYVSDRNVTGEVVECIQLLVTSPNAPVQATAENILQGLVGFVKLSSTLAGSTQQLAFSSINALVSKVLFDQSDLVRSTLLGLIPVLRRLWSTKLQTVRDELLVTVMFCVIILLDAVRKEPTEGQPSEMLTRSIEGLTHTLYSEYLKRPEKEMLQIDEILLHKDTAKNDRPIYGPRLGNQRSEQSWTLVWAIATLVMLSERIAFRTSDDDASQEGPSKRRRFNSGVDDIFRDAVSATGTRRICALQLVPFLENGHLENGTSFERKEELIQRLIPSIVDDNSAASSWTMVALASYQNSFTGCSAAKLPPLKNSWVKIVDLTSRAVSSFPTSRAACNLMSLILESDLLDYSVVTEYIRSTLASASLNGPSTLSDASLGLWASIARRKTQLNLASVQNASKQICSWLREAWAIDRRIRTAVESVESFLACTERPFELPPNIRPGTTGSVAGTWCFMKENSELLEYLFGIDEVVRNANPWNGLVSWVLGSSNRQHTDDSVILELLRSKSESFLQTWRAISEDKSLHVTPDILQILTSFCITSALFVACQPERLGSQVQDLDRNCQVLWSGLIECMAAYGPRFIVPSLEILSPLLPSSLPNTNDIFWKALSPLIAPLAKLLERIRQGQESAASVASDAMDMDDRLTTGDDQISTDQSILSLNRQQSPLISDASTFQRCLTVQMSVLLRGDTEDNSPEQAALVDYLNGLNSADMLSASHYLSGIFHAWSNMPREHILRILEDFGEKCLSSYEMERCEASNSLCICMMTGFATSWANDQSDTLNESAMDVYNWFIQDLLSKKRASPNIYVLLLQLLQTVLDTWPSYGSDQSLPSPRTSLLKILHEGDIQVKFSAAKLLPGLFGRFLFKDHDVIFDDVLENLPRDPDWLEGIALRLFVLSRLASEWHTLLRRSIYHMFETPAHVPLSLGYAQKCMKSTSNALGLSDSRELFRLFASQILYTWTETQSFTAMPFSIFEYATLEEMLADVQDEIVGQMMMRGRESEIQEFADLLEIPHIDLIKASFPKAEAYSIARDISTPPGQGSQPKGVEVRLRKLLGAEGFITEIEAQFPRVITTFFRSLDRFDQIERAFSKRPKFQYASDIQARIVGNCAPQSSLPANQQPSFRARYLLDELDFLCKLAGFDLESMWTPTLATFVCRSLLESIHPALGSLHKCSVIRKIRILVCLCGSIVLQDYPFEMLLHSLRPFISDIHCSEDALGIMWYLLEAGKRYLTENPGFTAGICITTFATLSSLFSLKSGKNTDEGQFRSVLTNAERFHQWLCDFVEKENFANWNLTVKESFFKMFNLSLQISHREQTSGFKLQEILMLELLTDRGSANSLLGKPMCDLALSLLCSDFERSLDPKGAIPAEHLDSSHLVVPLWHTLHKFDGGQDYRLWAASVIGRSFASNGQIDDNLLREQDLSLFVRAGLDEESVFCHSKARIIQALCDKLQTQDNIQAGLIEHTLQTILNNITTNCPEVQPCAEVIPDSLMKALLWNPYTCPEITLSSLELERCSKTDISATGLTVAEWARNISLFLSGAVLDDPVIGPLRKSLNVIPDLAVQILPYIIHDTLLAERDVEGPLKQAISSAFREVLSSVHEKTTSHARVVINCILYLRNQPFPEEATIAQRDKWLEIDFAKASSAAHLCGLQKTSLLFLEIEASRIIAGSRRSSVSRFEPPVGLVHSVFKNIDDPDLFYGIQQSSSLQTVMERLEYEGSGFKNLLFQSAQYDSEIQLLDNGNPFGVLKALNATNLQGISNTMLTASGTSKDTQIPSDSSLKAAMSLQQWDIPVSPLDSSPQATIFRAFQSLHTSSSLSEVVNCIDNCILTTLDGAIENGRSELQLRTAMRAMGILAEMGDVIQSPSPEDMQREWDKIIDRSSWLKTESYNEVGEILSWHEGLSSSIRKQELLRSKQNLSLEDSRLMEAKVFRQSLEVTRSHGISQASLKSAISLSKLSVPCGELGMNIEGAATFDLANVLWDQGEMTASIRMLQQLKGQGDLNKQAIPLSRAELLVTLGHHVAEARLEKPELILQEYLYPAVKELKGASEGEAAGRVYHGFATFCDEQLLNPDVLEDFKRVKQLRDRKEKELLGLEEMIKTSQGREKESLKAFSKNTKRWFDLDDREYQRLLRSQEAFLQQCLENYLLALRESDIYNNDALRFCALWLDKSDSKTANTAVSRYVNDVPSWKFAALMNQLSSRLLDVTDDFQSLLTELVFRICAEHPFHGMYQIFASSKSKGGKDKSSHSRFRAANKLVDRLKNDKSVGSTWVAVHNMNITYVRFAVDQPDGKYKSGAKIRLDKLATGKRLEQDVTTYRLPPPTMKIDIRPDRDYSNVPSTATFLPEFTIASGVSAPKIVTAVATDGVRYKQLYKGGNDDLRQDAIMEQVFEQVSSLLKDHQPTRHRNLGIRTYKVLPLTLNAGIIEFVPNTVPLGDFLMPAHQRYFPKDMKPNACRKQIAEVQTKSFEQRVRTYRQVTESFHPVMKYFFMERFNNPDDWFSRRLSYTRSTAAISILGHVLGLGDRHGHNILLDEKTGEVVHIDLGVAFEQGRILPIPEVVPFRLTRDLVDGFGITKTEGVFRRCCEFTLEALRKESYSIMTILDVLRYDPLYSWTVSPLRMKKMQDNQEGNDGPPVLSETTTEKPSENEPSEADRALKVVAKKLGKTLSVTATVNELIQQATDEKNLAVLYCGWAAYA
ncbi:hypothetical protein N7532_005575 [Penicillium argentinense]|uniref:Serine/threonine-protein kinase Tel1 n=1 Tax=Penicillium argentinense TaxID=1131581 RepID=A0A9W9FEB0_9EURO|nr:uncharacterized protein N7532_005575 [Penicillium argentinense]KAJ5098574.1 hypothetical protein N7532_005575 [Penicillium argentinense]